MTVLNESLLLGADQGGGSGYQIERSLRFNSADSAYLSRTFSAGNRKTWTWSGWVKVVKPWDGASGAIRLFHTWTTAYNRLFLLYNRIYFDQQGAGGYQNFGCQSDALLRDPTAWMNLVIAVDTTQATPANRIKYYVNGQFIPNKAGSSYPNQNSEPALNEAGNHDFGSGDAYLADIHFIDGQALDPTSFGEFDTNGVWQPKAYSGSYGTNGFHLDFADNSTAAALGTDTSGNGNTWTVNNLSVTQTGAHALLANQASSSVTIADDASLQLGQSDFTIEYFVNLIATTNYKTLLGKGYGGAGRYIFQTAANTTQIIAYLDTAPNMVTLTGPTLNINQWYHIALQRSGSNYYLYVDGVQHQTAAVGTSNLNDANDLLIGTGGANLFANAKISNLRIVKGTAVYPTGGFSKPTGNLTAVAGTSLLTLQDSNFVDNSSYGHTLVNNGTASTVYQPVFGPIDPDSLVDTPTNYGEDTGAGGEVRGNYCTWNPLDKYTDVALANGNLDFSQSNAGFAKGTIGVSSGKWYWEVTKTDTANQATGLCLPSITPTATFTGGTGTGSCGINQVSGTVFALAPFSTANGTTQIGAISNGSVIGCALDADNGTFKIYVDGVLRTANHVVFTPGITVMPSMGTNVLAGVYPTNFGQRQWAYAPPAGFKALCTTNLPDPAIAAGSTAMDVALYTGNGSTQTISGLGFSPDLVWVKSRTDGTDYHVLADTVRGAGKTIYTNVTTNEGGPDWFIPSITSDGFGVNVNPNDGVNTTNHAYVAWTWDAGSSTVTNTDGTISSQVRANPSAGFSILTYTGVTNSSTIGHGLGVAPSLIINKSRGGAGQWVIYHAALGFSYYGGFSTAAFVNNSAAWKTSPTSSVYTIGSAAEAPILNTTGETYVSYCFAPVAGYSAFGSYTGNGNADGPFVYTGFRPRWILIKSTQAGSSLQWRIFDTARDSYNDAVYKLYPNDSLAENGLSGESTATNNIAILSNGFKLTTTYGETNNSGYTYIYAAFAEHPFQISRAR